MSLVDWISSNPDTAVTIVGGVAAYLWNKARGRKTDDLWDTAVKLGHQAVAGLLKDPNLYDDAYVRAKLNSSIWAGLSRLGVKLNPVLEKLVDEVVEHVKGELAEQLWKHNLDGFIRVQTQTAAIK